MKPSIRSTGLAFLILGVALGGWGFLGIIPSPVYIGLGATLALTGVGVLFRARLAHNAGLLFSTATVGLGSWNLYRALEDQHHVGMVKAGITLAVGLYLLASLVFVRRHFRPATK
jgi:hypothetical protein